MSIYIQENQDGKHQGSRLDTLASASKIVLDY